MDEILNNLEEISNLLAENENFSIEDFTPISKLIAKTQNKVIRLCEVSRSANVKINEPFEVEETCDRFEVRINNFIDKDGLWDKETVIVKVD